MSAITPKFKVGDKVTRKAFTCCFGESLPAETGLVITAVRFIEEKSIASYYRCTAEDPVYTLHGFRQFEAAERFFEAEVVNA